VGVELAVDLVPTVDQETPVATYLDWTPEGTVIKVYAVNSSYPGIQADSRSQAKAHCELVFGRILEANYVPGRAFFRVARKSV